MIETSTNFNLHTHCGSTDGFKVQDHKKAMRRISRKLVHFLQYVYYFHQYHSCGDEAVELIAKGISNFRLKIFGIIMCI